MHVAKHGLPGLDKLWRMHGSSQVPMSQSSLQGCFTVERLSVKGVEVGVDTTLED